MSFANSEFVENADVVEEIKKWLSPFMGEMGISSRNAHHSPVRDILN